MAERSNSRHLVVNLVVNPVVNPIVNLVDLAWLCAEHPFILPAHNS